MTTIKIYFSFTIYLLFIYYLFSIILPHIKKQKLVDFETTLLTNHLVFIGKIYNKYNITFVLCVDYI